MAAMPMRMADLIDAAVAGREGWRHGCDLFKPMDAVEELVQPLPDRPVRVALDLAWQA